MSIFTRLILSTIIVVLGVGLAHAKPGKKVTICHIPPGNPANAHTITVGEAAVSAHLGHGDQIGECVTGCTSDAACDDGNACTADACDASAACAHTLVNCDDGNVCTRDDCNEATGCFPVANNGAQCDDGNDCTSTDACVGTTCRGAAIPGCCRTATDCDDQQACTDDMCVSRSCSNPPVDCTVANKCLAGFCDAAGDCDTTAVSCDDSNICTDDDCDPATGCTNPPTQNPPEPTEQSCGDGLDNDCDGAVDEADPDCVAVCGNGVVESGEECDDGASNGDTKPCTVSCKTAVCGDGLICSDPACTSGDGGVPEECEGDQLPPGFPPSDFACLPPGHENQCRIVAINDV